MSVESKPIESCETCLYLGSDSDGNYPELAQYWAVCDKKGNERFSNLKTFPFKKKMPCFVLHFWHSEFADMVDDTDESYDEAAKLYRQKYHGEVVSDRG